LLAPARVKVTKIRRKKTLFGSKFLLSLKNLISVFPIVVFDNFDRFVGLSGFWVSLPHFALGCSNAIFLAI